MPEEQDYNHIIGILKIQKDLVLKLTNNKNLDYSLNEIINSTLSLPGVDSAGIYIHNTRERKLELIACKGFGDNFINTVKSYSSTSVQYAMVIEGKSNYMDFSAAGHAGIDVISEENIKALGIIPLITDGKITGVLNIASHVNTDFPEYSRPAAETFGLLAGFMLLYNTLQAK